MKRRLLCLLLAAAVFLTAWQLPVLPVSAEDEPAAAENSCGDRLTWEFNEDTGTLTISGTGSMNLWSSPYQVPWASFCDQIKTIILPKDLRSVGRYAFCNCTALAEVNLPDSLAIIDSNAFEGCTSLESIRFPSSLEEIRWYAFSGCTSLKSVMIPEKITKIDSHLFEGCTSLTTVQLPASLTEIGNYAFANSGLTQLKLPESVTQFGTCAFGGTPWLAAKQAKNPMVTVRGILIDATACTGEVTIPTTVSTIGDGAFFGCTQLTAVTIPESVTRIGNQAFAYCTGLTSVELPDSVTELGNALFKWCYSLTSVTFPASVKRVTQEMFANCTAMTTPIFPENVTEIGAYAYAGCTRLKDVTIPATVRNIREAAFYCTLLETLTVQNPGCKINDTDYTLPENTVICGYPGSLAEQYAERYGRSFQSLEGEPECVYTYEIIPLLAPLNNYFLVKTNNPDPNSFQFIDRDTKYSTVSTISFLEIRYPDVLYESDDSLRVAGGYIFSSLQTDGGEMQMQVNTADENSEPEWVDFGGTYTLPELYDPTDYLIHTYADKDSFFENMDAVQDALSSFNMYGGAYIRGNVIRTADYWSVLPAGHFDQLFYIVSPYKRSGNYSLLATQLYPFRYDSIGFPSIMAEASERLNSESYYQWSQSSHAYIDVTYGGITKTYGGSSNIIPGRDAQGISADKIMRQFDLSEDDRAEITVESLLTLQLEYAKIKMEDDTPREDSLTFTEIAEHSGEDGEWSKIYGGYTYFYKADDSGNEYDHESDVGNLNYAGTILGYFEDVWLDGRYINEGRIWEKGEVFADHPASDIVLRDVTVPDVTYTSRYAFNKKTGQRELVYDVTEVREKTATVQYKYSEEEGLWRAVSTSVHKPSINYSLLEEMVTNGQVDAKYLKTLVLTKEDVEALQPDRNTNASLPCYYLYDGTAEPGTFVLMGDMDGSGTVEIADAVLLMRLVTEDDSLTLSPDSTNNADADEDALLTLADVAALLNILNT